ncbi:MAG: iron-sulfur cluster assembly scaffold protein [Geminicoccaceae bacterium]|jgi:nitrogen fixation NifU-like protein|nr:iron-sulfur cluster assembly scaffold protein [Geminicoccaceae bacterium]MCB9966246.1 iron-sulfur cluster assembly scaffold protein [Geminicoccaceae bacterium]HRY26228.1 iron-sulfur cluster assembly scaffold protein [Geminicoccaceae bacterium]
MNEALYNRAIIEAARDKRHAGRLEHPGGTATTDNPLCGDRVTLDLEGEAGRIAAVAHKTRGCLLTQAAASLLAAHAVGRPIDEVVPLRGAIRAYLDGTAEDPPFPELAMLAPVRAVKSRHECVTIAFDALAEAAVQLATEKPS